MKHTDHLPENDTETLDFLRTRYPLYHLSNVFFRDIQYGIRILLERRGVKVGYTEAERLAEEFVSRLEKKKILVPIDRQSWVLYYDDFKTKPVKRAAPVPAAKPSPAAKPAERPAGGLPPLKSAAPAGVPKPAGGLPPLKSAAPVAPKGAPAPQQAGQAAPPVAAPEPPKPAPVASAPTPIQESAPVSKPTAPGEKKGLPPIRSSVPVGSKK